MKPDLTGFPKGYKRPNVLFTVAEFRSLEDDMHMGKISYSRMIEIINEKAKEYAKQNLLNKPDVSGQLADHQCKFYVNADWTGYSRCECGKAHKG